MKILSDVLIMWQLWLAVYNKLSHFDHIWKFPLPFFWLDYIRKRDEHRVNMNHWNMVMMYKIKYYKSAFTFLISLWFPCAGPSSVNDCLISRLQELDEILSCPCDEHSKISEIQESDNTKRRASHDHHHHQRRHPEYYRRHSHDHHRHHHHHHHHHNDHSRNSFVTINPLSFT